MWSRCATDSFQFKKNKEKVFDLNLIDLTSYKFYLHVFLFNDLISGVYFAVHSVEAIKLVGSQTDCCICGILDRKNSIRAFCRGGKQIELKLLWVGHVFSRLVTQISRIALMQFDGSQDLSAFLSVNSAAPSDWPSIHASRPLGIPSW